MKRLFGVAMLAAACGAEPTDAGPAVETRFPIEVVGVCSDSGSCAEAELSIAVDGAALAAATEAELRLTVHNLVEPDMAHVIVNDALVELDAASGLVRAHGGVASGSVAIDVSALRSGDNRLRFEYTRPVADVSGYRVLAVELVLDDDSAPLELDWDDPASWLAPSTDAAALERGRRYFSEESRDGGPVCARCHADSGADLAYFAFSNRGIVERARHHVFSEAEARDIASHLRSLDVPRRGTVFDPPFQPGEAAVGAAGAGHRAVVDDASFGEHAFGAGGAEALPDVIAWDYAASFDFRTLPAPVQAPAWFRWLPREVDETLHERVLDASGLTLRELERTLDSDPSLENAQRYMARAVDLGSTVLAETGDHKTRIELLRLAAVKLWEWSRRQGFETPPYGFPDRSPAYPYEVGFAFFEAAQADFGAGDAWLQTIEWWWVQLAVDPGRGQSNGLRPLNYSDVLIAAESAGLGPNALVALHLYGSWEESRGEMEPMFGSDLGPVRLLEVPLRSASERLQAALWRRFLVRQKAWLDAGHALDAAHRLILEKTWQTSCSALDAETRAELRAIAASDVSLELSACP